MSANEPVVAEKRRSSRWWGVARIVVAVAALAFILHSIQYHDVVVQGKTQPGAISLVRGLRIAPGLMSLVVFAAVPVLVAWRWRILLRVVGIVASVGLVLKLTYAGSLLNFFLVGTTGGDLIKAYWLGRLKGRRAEAFVSVFVDRLMGLAFIVVFAAVLIVILSGDPHIRHWARPVAGLLVALAVAVAVLFSSRLRRLVRFDRWGPKLPLVGHLLTRIDQALLAYRRRPWSLAYAMAVTFAVQILASTSGYFVGAALQINAPVWYYWLYVPLAFLVGSVPVSAFWGVGLLEGAYVVFFVGSGFATGTQAAMLAMSVRLVQLFWSLPGSVVVARGVPKDVGDDAV